MTATRQIALSIALLLIAGAGWFAWDRGWFTANRDSTAATAQSPPGGGSGGSVNRGGQGGAGQGGGGAGFTRGGGFGGPAPVVAAPVEIDTTGIEVTAVGTVAASKAVTIFPQDTGVVTAVSFQPGMPVTAGQALVKLDDADQQLAVERAQVALDAAEAARRRTQQLAKSSNASAVDVASADTAVQNAEIDLKAARLDLAKRTITAPFAGTIGLTDVSVGDLVNSGKAITTLDDMATVTVSFQVPERASGLVAVGQHVAATTDALAGQSFAGKVTAVDSRVDAATRALSVEASVPNTASALKPGMALTLSLEFKGEPHPAVSSLSIQWDRQGSYVWKVDGEIVHRVSVHIVARRSGVVTVAADLKAGDLVVTDGVLRLREGATVTLAGSGGGEGGATQRPPGTPSTAEPGPGGAGADRPKRSSAYQPKS